MRQIPKRLLIHSADYYKKPVKDRWGKEGEPNKTLLSFVRIEPSSTITRDKNNQEIKLSAVLFYDCKNSRPRGLKIAEDDVIIFNGQQLKVVSVDPCYDEGRLHHYEIGLVRHA